MESLEEKIRAMRARLAAKFATLENRMLAKFKHAPGAQDQKGGESHE